MKYLIPLILATLILAYAWFYPAEATIRSVNPQFTTTDIQPALGREAYRWFDES